MENTLNRPAFTTVYLKENKDSAAYVDQNLIEKTLLPDDIWSHTFDEYVVDLMGW